MLSLLVSLNATRDRIGSRCGGAEVRAGAQGNSNVWVSVWLSGDSQPLSVAVRPLSFPGLAVQPVSKGVRGRPWLSKHAQPGFRTPRGYGWLVLAFSGCPWTALPRLE